MTNLSDLGIDILADESGSPEYPFDWNYEWCGGSSYVVIVGDLIDLFRPPSEGEESVIPIDEKTGIMAHEFIQIELKIIKFLNMLDKQAKQYGGRVIKLAGNHEVANFFCNIGTNRTFVRRYITKYLKDIGDNYYKMPCRCKESGTKCSCKGVSRVDIFNVGNIGFELYKQGGGIKTLLQINNNIFVHGQLVGKSKKYHEDLNNRLNAIKKYDSTVPEYVEFGDLALKDKDPKNHLWWREYGDEDAASDRIKDPLVPTENTLYRKGIDFCNHVSDNFDKFCDNDEDCKKYIHKDTGTMRVIIGHCPQHYASWYDLHNNTFSVLVDGGNITTLTPPINSDDVQEPDKGIVFGITMECAYDNYTDYKIYKIDCGTSRSFEQNMGDIQDSSDYYRYFLSRTPQLLRIQGNKIEIIRSKMSNTYIHQPRPWFNDITKRIFPDGIGKSQFGGSVSNYVRNKNMYTNLTKYL
jgi:hypothetical protein